MGKYSTLKELFPENLYKLVKVYKLSKSGKKSLRYIDGYVYAIMIHFAPLVSIAKLARYCGLCHQTTHRSLRRLHEQNLVGATVITETKLVQKWGPIKYNKELKQIDQDFLRDVVSRLFVTSSKPKDDGTTHTVVVYNWAAIPIIHNPEKKTINVRKHKIRHNVVLTCDAVAEHTRNKVIGLRTATRLLGVSRQFIRSVRLAKKSIDDITVEMETRVPKKRKPQAKEAQK